MKRHADLLAETIADLMPGDLPDCLAAFAADIAARHGDVVAVLGYGSCLRNKSLQDGLIDFYVLTDSAEGVSGNALSRLACRVVPPNVYYAEFAFQGETYRAKYAVVPVGLFEAKVSARTPNPYFWARFAQPSALVRVRDETARQRVLGALAEAARTAVRTFRELAGPGAGARDMWTAGLKATYASELRSEGASRAGEIVAANLDYYAAINARVEDGAGAVARDGWRAVQVRGRLLSVVRLVKAGFTFQGGADYLAWKISRHSGQQVTLSPWQRRHPILASVVLLPKLLRSGAVK